MNNFALNFRIKSIFKSFVTRFDTLHSFTFQIVRGESLTMLNITVYNLRRYPIIYKCLIIDNYNYEITL